MSHQMPSDSAGQAESPEVGVAVSSVLSPPSPQPVWCRVITLHQLALGTAPARGNEPQLAALRLVQERIRFRFEVGWTTPDQLAGCLRFIGKGDDEVTLHLIHHLKERVALLDRESLILIDESSELGCRFDDLLGFNGGHRVPEGTTARVYGPAFEGPSVDELLILLQRNGEL